MLPTDRSNIMIIRELHFCAGHRVMNHESKCAHLHGHNYELWLTCRLKTDNKLDDIGRVADFSVVKRIFGDFIDRQWDHGFLLHANDTAGLAAIRAFEDMGGPGTADGSCRGKQKLYIMSENPTAENIGRELLHLAPSLFAAYGVRNVELVKVTVFETPRCAAEVSRAD